MKLDKSMLITVVVGAFAAAAVAVAIKKFLPDSVPGAAIVKEIADKA